MASLVDDAVATLAPRKAVTRPPLSRLIIARLSTGLCGFAAILLMVLPSVAGAAGLAASWRIGSEPLLLSSAPGFAGAVSSIRFRGREYLNAADHGRLLQGAVQFGFGECLNPTLAGASSDPPGRSSSVVLQAQVSSAAYRTRTRMAYWNRPGQRCNLAPGVHGVAMNGTDVSDLIYSQAMTPGFEGHAGAVLDRIDVTSVRPRPPASVEALTGYMPPVFDTFEVYDPDSGGFRRDRLLDTTSGERTQPLVLSTADGAAAMGAVGLEGAVPPRYAGYRSATVSKWSVVFHEIAPFAPGDHRFVCIWLIGTRRQVEAAIAEIMRAQARAAAVLWGSAAATALSLLAVIWALGWRAERRRATKPLTPL